jgi:hypothetical protein
VVLPDGNSKLEILPGPESITEIRGIDHSDSRVLPEDMLVIPPGVVLPTPLFSESLSWFEPCICSPQLCSGMLCFVALCCLCEDLNENVFVCFNFIEDIEFTVPTGCLGSNELGTFFKGEDRQSEHFSVISRVASIDRRLMAVSCAQ